MGKDCSKYPAVVGWQVANREEAIGDKVACSSRGAKKKKRCGGSTEETGIISEG